MYRAPLHLSLVGMVFLLLFESNDVVRDLSSKPWQSQLLSWWAYEGTDFTPAAAVGRIGHGIVLLPPSYCNQMGNYTSVPICNRIANLDNRKGTVQSVQFIFAVIILIVICVAHFLIQWKQHGMKRSSSQRKMEGKGHHDTQKPVDVGRKQYRKRVSKAESSMSDETKFAETGTNESRSTSNSLSSPLQRRYNLRCRSKKSIKNDML